eukprot:SAG11_NODE_3562_length_2370_cov_4.250550_3_plen_141_part_00
MCNKLNAKEYVVVSDGHWLVGEIAVGKRICDVVWEEVSGTDYKWWDVYLLTPGKSDWENAMCKLLHDGDYYISVGLAHVKLSVVGTMVTASRPEPGEHIGFHIEFEPEDWISYLSCTANEYGRIGCRATAGIFTAFRDGV